MPKPDPALPTVLMVLEATFPVVGGGGAESQVMSLGRCLVARGCRVEVVVPMVANGPQLEHELCEGLHVTRIRYPRVRLLGGLVMLAKLAALLVRRRRGYQVVHAHIANNMAAVAAVVGRLLGKPVLVKLTGMKEMKGGILDAQPGLATRLKKWAMARATGLQATSTRIGNLLVERGFDRERVRLLPNGVAVERFSGPRDEAARRRLCGESRFVALFVGRLAPEKGHEMLFHAWAASMAGRPDAKLLLVGDGPMRQPLAALAAQLGITGQVVFAGHADDVAPFIAMADLGLLTSLAEGLSNALLEYMAGGLPVIGSRVSGTEDFVAPGETGWLFEPGVRDELAQCLREAAALPPEDLQRLGQRARQRILTSASLEAVTDKLLGHYGVAPVVTAGMQPAK
jgi:glycosyltransferase involved in cell wall biosynthesis